MQLSLNDTFKPSNISVWRKGLGRIGMLDPHVGLGMRGYPKSNQIKTQKTQTKQGYRVIFLNRVAVAAWKQRQDEYTFNLIKI